MISLIDEVDLLRKVPFFSSIDGGKLKLIAYTAEKQAFEHGSIVFAQGSTETDAYFILDGVADVLAETGSGPIVVAQLPRHTLFGEISAFCDVPRTATIRASGQLVTLRIRKEYLMELIREFPDIATQVIRVLANRLVDTTRDLTAARSARGPAGSA